MRRADLREDPKDMSISTESVASAMDAYLKTQEITARNVANITTPGFKRNIAVVETVEEGGGEEGSGVPSLTQVSIDLSPGPLHPTHGELELGLRGDGYFTIQGPNGLRYTRNGAFRLDENRILVTQGGDPVLGEMGEIQIPQSSEPVTVNASGRIAIGDQEAGTLRIAAFEEPGMLRQTGACEFDGESAVPKPAGDYAVHQGFLEGSNVQPVIELVRMMASLRDFEASARSLKAIEDSAAKLYGWARS